MLVKTPKNELKNELFMKMNPQSLNVYKTTLVSAKSILGESFEVKWRKVTSYELHHSSNIFSLEMSLN